MGDVIVGRFGKCQTELAVELIDEGLDLAERGNVDGAEACYKRAIAADSTLAEAHFNLGCILFDKCDVAGAVERFTLALAIDPEFADAHFNIAMVLPIVGRRKDARQHWKRFLELAPDDDQAWAARENMRHCR